MKKFGLPCFPQISTYLIEVKRHKGATAKRNENEPETESSSDSGKVNKQAYCTFC